MKKNKLRISSVRVHQDTIQRHPELLESIRYLSGELPSLITASSDVSELTDTVTSLLRPPLGGVFEVFLVDQENEPTICSMNSDYDVCLFIKENNLKVQ